MSIITYYARLNREQLDGLLASADGLADLYRSVPDGAELIDLDKASEVVSWLLSPCKRSDQARIANDLAEDLGDEAPFDELPPEAPLDSFAVAIEGRGSRKESRLQAGYGPACIFEPAEVKEFARLLSGVDEPQLREQLDFPLMDKLFLPVEYWEEEGEETFAEYIMPLFRRLQSFYQNAAAAQQHVLIWYA